MRRFLLLLLAVIFCLPAWAQDEPTSGTLTHRTDRLLRIGFLRPEGEADMTPVQLEALREYLLAVPEVTAAMETEGYEGIGLFSTDGGRDMLRRLNALEFDVAFVPARAWAEQQTGYTVILQTRRERDFTSSRGGRVLQRGVIVISARSPLFAQDELSDDDVAEYLTDQRIAVVASQSVAGFVAPLLEMSRRFGIQRPRGGLIWFESSAEVTKAVVAGLVDVGACEEGAMEETLDRSGLNAEQKNDVRRVILRTNPVMTDPVIVHPGLAPQVSELGRELKRALRDFSLQGGFGRVQLQSARDSDYQEVRLLLTEFDERVGEIGR
ncbi:phosphate/phosphite/phosphonate ABC transporter substrate-binding protein [bacterium]|nr:phosphate/phosphite/phosphonate ABC transporter substrate-binding protein [bacterium]